MASTITSNVGNLSAQFLTVGLAFALALIKITAELKEDESVHKTFILEPVCKGWRLGGDGYSF